MRALSFFFALMVGLAMAFLAPAMAGGHVNAPEAMLAPTTAASSPEAADSLAADALLSNLLAELNVDLAPSLDAAA